jgi:hypothetical protein
MFEIEHEPCQISNDVRGGEAFSIAGFQSHALPESPFEEGWLPPTQPNDLLKSRIVASSITLGANPGRVTGNPHLTGRLSLQIARREPII